MGARFGVLCCLVPLCLAVAGFPLAAEEVHLRLGLVEGSPWLAEGAAERLRARLAEGLGERLGRDLSVVRREGANVVLVSLCRGGRDRAEAAAARLQQLRREPGYLFLSYAERDFALVSRAAIPANGGDVVAMAACTTCHIENHTNPLRRLAHVTRKVRLLSRESLRDLFDSSCAPMRAASRGMTDAEFEAMRRHFQR